MEFFSYKLKKKNNETTNKKKKIFYFLELLTHIVLIPLSGLQKNFVFKR